MGRLTHERLNGIQNGYWSPNKKQELVDRLAAYENTDLDPEQVEHVKKTAEKYLLEKAEGKVNGWIPVEVRLPEEKANPVSQDFYEYQVTAKFGNVKDVRHYKYGNGHWWHGPGIVDKYVIAWRPLPEPYHPDRERSEGE